MWKNSHKNLGFLCGEKFSQTSMIWPVEKMSNVRCVPIMTRIQINDTFLFQNRVKVKVVGEVS